MVRRLGLGKNNHLTYASLALNPRYETLTWKRVFYHLWNLTSNSCTLIRTFALLHSGFVNSIPRSSACIQTEDPPRFIWVFVSVFRDIYTRINTYIRLLFLCEVHLNYPLVSGYWPRTAMYHCLLVYYDIELAKLKQGLTMDITLTFWISD